MSTSTINTAPKITPESIFQDQSKFIQDVLERPRLEPQQRKLALIGVASASLYGATMGAFHSLPQAFSSAIKVPVLFYATLLFSLPALHFIGLFLGSKMRFAKTLTVMLHGIAVTSVLLCAFAPISMFFTLSGSSYAFTLCMHVLIFGFTGICGLVTIRRNALLAIGDEQPKAAIRLLHIWFLLYMFLGTQLAYLMAPFVGHRAEFIWMHRSEGNFYSYLFELLAQTLAGR